VRERGRERQLRRGHAGGERHDMQRRGR
jgi:hypothetical protein